MTLGAFLAGCALLGVLVVGAAFTAAAARRRWLPEWRGPAARLVEAIVGLTTVLVEAEVLGTFGLLRRGVTSGAVAVTGVVALLVLRPRDSGGPPAPTVVHERDRFGAAAAIVSVSTVVAEWGINVVRAFHAGIIDTDSLRYHLPFAAVFVSTHSTTHLTYTENDPTVAFNPASSELLQAVVMAPFRSDIAVPLVNLGWLALAMLAAWCLGSRWGRSGATVTALCAFLAWPLISFGSGSGSNDVAVVALLLSAAALLVLGGPHSGPVAVCAALAAGLAAGTKLYAPAVAVALAVGAIVVAGPRRRSIALRWTVGLVVGGGYWYARNLVRTGSPVPSLHTGVLPSAPTPQVEVSGQAVSHFLLHRTFYSHVIPHGLRYVAGGLWPLPIVLAVAGIVLAFVRSRDPLLRVLSAAAVVSALTYVVTPTTAGLFPGSNDPSFFFGLNSRYAGPALVLGLVLLPLCTADNVLVGRLVVAASLVAVVAAQVRVHGSIPAWPPGFRGDGVVILAVTLAVLTAGAWWSMGDRPLPVRAIAVGAAVGLAVLVVTGAVYRADYLRDRYTGAAVVDHTIWAWAAKIHDARIGFVGVSGAYPLYGPHLTNRVDYVGLRGPHGAFSSYPTCAAYRDALARGSFDFVVVGSAKAAQDGSDERAWTATDPDAHLVVSDGSLDVFALNRTGNPSACS